ncbi:putative proteasome regulatory particle subunit protein [Venustampulla echinocandica]|uniref:Putative proteasome regulatory particle subunit protein n=1 Tax=Venustampulla echinocandica TaxID=2656787 RepID=A0A370T9U8_9HELO|nr:putative proteasome regulatory particle subunit protein [Venustampulla echinocandica]RDL30438.1 putative proteasome regulatory particle subunit protein [Venustampulla echinocandica]
MNVDTIPDFLADQRDAAPADLQHLFISFEDLWERKLWHQLTDSLIELFQNPASASQRLPFYKTFILTFADKINQLKLVTLALSAASQCRDGHERLSFLESVAKKVDNPNSQDAYVYATVAVATVKLELKDLEGTRKDLDKSEKILDHFDSVETIVHAAFYRVNAEYYQSKLDFASYYRNALLYLACIDLADLTPAERRSRAYDLSIAALVSDTIYNFGELLLHPILNSLVVEDAWLRDLLFAFNRGDLTAYDVSAGHISSNTLLAEHRDGLRQKIYLAALTEAVFRRPPHDRTMSFRTIAEETKVRPDEIEHLIMKALSLGLLRGSIDQVDEIARINWVQPKVLDMGQIDNMRLRLQEWDSSVNSLGNWIESKGQDVWAA